MEPFPYVYIDADGTARELHAAERTWLETEYKGGDGAAPNVKDSYEERNGWDELNGYLARTALPAGMPVGDAPTEDPRRPFTREDYIAKLRKKGLRVIENADGSLKILGREN